MAIWPGTLPTRMHIGATDVRQTAFIRTPTDAGPPLQRKRFTAASRTISGTMHLTAAQRTTFDTFYITTISEGSDEFEWADPIDGSTQNFRFISVPQFSAIKGGASGVTLWRVSLTVERLP